MAVPVYRAAHPDRGIVDCGGGVAPIDYKLFVFDGVVAVIQVDTGRFTYHRRRLYTPAWKKLDVHYQYDDIGYEIPRPFHLAEMIAAAELLGRELDFIRADFYDTADRWYFGELTTTPGCGWDCFDPKEFDRILGARWELPAWRLLRS